jgi:predicted RNase H-like nuclease
MIAGVDGTSKGWVAVLYDDDLGNPTALFIERLAQLPRNLRIVAVDVPIGLPDRGDRDADRLARQALREPRRRSVFPCPIRSLLDASSWEDACTRTELIDGHRVSKQTFAILRKIKEADAFAAVWSAWRILQGTAEKFPGDRILDGMGLLMRIWA